MSDAVKALQHPFATGLLPRPRGHAFFLRAETDPELDDGWRRALVCEQSFKPAYESLRAAGFTVEAELPDDGYELGLCLMTKHKAETLANVARAWRALKPGGVLVCAGGNDVGAGTIQKAFAQAVGELSTLSKHHCKVFWAKRGDAVPPAMAEWEAAGALQKVPATGCWSRPGLYNWNKVDEGSALLVRHLPADLAGRAADLGAGWGYLSLELLKRCPAIVSLDLFEAEWQGLRAARANLEGAAARLDFHWHDVAAGLPRRAFDVVVMNPPFHSGRATDVDLGRAFVANALAALVPGGRLLMVANRQLPYEAILQANSRRWSMLAETGVYKVISSQA
ncbi:MAG TPA: class I SAM-dependent methyltransferase [Magnetospirillum sp.]|jgi:16S rRNA (guanine1207-N2)-methyltransferase|nr:class I SAM-dependent methyltransferase [Magnetospirillum sp.]